MNGFAGKRILFIGAGFYDYDASIVERLQRYGADVQAFFGKPAVLRRRVLAPALRRAGVKGLALIKRHEQRIFRTAECASYDFVLIITGIDLRPVFLDALRRKLPRAEFILYAWDSLARHSGIEERLTYFDRILTFDRQDCAARPDLKFRPLFYREDPPCVEARTTDETTVDLCFIGKLHSDRLELIRRIQSMAQSQGVSFFVYLYTGLITWLELTFAGNSRDVHFKALQYRMFIELSRRAAVIVDLPHPAQSGMTMRAIEAVGLGKKLITTAADVVNYDFFTNDSVQVLRADDLSLNQTFIRSPAAPLPEKIRRRYSLDAWLEDVFGLATAAR